VGGDGVGQRFRVVDGKVNGSRRILFPMDRQVAGEGRLPEALGVLQQRTPALESRRLDHGLRRAQQLNLLIAGK
jgi:hypothetical protein